MPTVALRDCDGSGGLADWVGLARSVKALLMALGDLLGSRGTTPT
jgi:hypothetical protein